MDSCQTNAVLVAASRFKELAAKWKRDTLYSSSISEKVSHPAYRTIISMGQAVVPFILKDLKINGGYWFSALSEITKVDPAVRNPKCSFKDLAAAWLDWGAKNGQLSI